MTGPTAAVAVAVAGAAAAPLVRRWARSNRAWRREVNRLRLRLLEAESSGAAYRAAADHHKARADALEATVAGRGGTR